MRRREVPGGVRFITFSCHRRLPLLGHAAIRDVFAEALAPARERHAFELFAWVVMLEHVHLLVRPHARLDEALRSLKTSVAKRVLSRWRELRAPILERIRTSDGALRFWQKGGGFDRNVRDEDEFCREVCYIHRNPVERGLVARPEDWTWSSVRWWMGERGGEIDCDPPPGDPRSWAMWKGYV
jgi:putative transposase